MGAHRRKTRYQKGEETKIFLLSSVQVILGLSGLGGENSQPKMQGGEEDDDDDDHHHHLPYPISLVVIEHLSSAIYQN